MKTIFLAFIDPSALPALRVAGALFLVIHLLAGVYFFRNRHRFFDPDPDVDGDLGAVRSLRVVVILIPWLFLTGRLFVEWVGLWFK